MNARPIMAVIEVISSRPNARDYNRYTGAMIDTLVRTASASGWTVQRHSADALGTVGLLAATAAAEAIVVCGGEDIDPVFYGGQSGYVGEGTHYPRADAAQIAVVRRAATRGTPLLGICRGHQIINVALGGTLVEHIEAPGHRNEDLPVEYILTEHPVLLDPNSRLASLLGGEYVLVQSAHHQVIASLGEGLSVAGWAHDGLPEAIEHHSLPITGVQWHPEAPAAVRGQLELLINGLSAQAELADARFSRRLVAA